MLVPADPAGATLCYQRLARTSTLADAHPTHANRRWWCSSKALWVRTLLRMLRAGIATFHPWGNRQSLLRLSNGREVGPCGVWNRCKIEVLLHSRTTGEPTGNTHADLNQRAGSCPYLEQP